MANAALLIVLSIITCSLVSTSNASHFEDKTTRQVYLYRLLNWCITGRGEYPLYEWPLNQFKPILQLTHKNEYQSYKSTEEQINLFRDPSSTTNPLEQYTLEFHRILCPNVIGMGSVPGGASGDKFPLLHRLHIHFKPVNPSATDNLKFQGLMIQAVHAPFDIGFPFGVFDTDQEFKCSDCNYTQYSRIVGCISRPDLSPMHPTTALFHYKLRGKDPRRAEAGREADADKILEYGYQSELHWNFKYANLPCSSAKIVEFWVLMVIDFERFAWAVKKFGPYNLNAFDASSGLGELTATAPEPDSPKFYKLSTPDETLIQPGLPLPIPPDCFIHPKTNPIQIGLKERPPSNAVVGRPRACIRGLRSFNLELCKSWEDRIRNNPVGASPPASAFNGSWVLDETNVVLCHDASAVQALDPDATRTRVRFEGDFDTQCTLRYPGAIFEKMTQKQKRQPYKVCPEWQGKFTCRGNPEDLHFDTSNYTNGEDSSERPFPSSHCSPCIPVTEELTTLPSGDEPFFKRTDHGVLMIYAFFFFNPVSMNIARFYKETLHEKQVKGWRLWLVIHVGFAAMASIVSYIGYTFPSFTEIDLHIGLGYGALIGVSSGIITGWFRHKNPILHTMMFYLHGLSGYGGWALAIASFVFAPGISKYTRLVSYAASAICLAAMAVMTVWFSTLYDMQSGVYQGIPMDFMCVINCLNFKIGSHLHCRQQRWDETSPISYTNY
ncbi:unnamed protein product [Orchesella dallaii]|uniref:Cytochrome b561 domain-containing protein n=1 Tax=Orchesella dallaii TaxID=48710 RepID=A0ABP1QEH0_9HEXA